MLSLLYWMPRRLEGVTAVEAVGDWEGDRDPVLRHQLRMLERQVARPQLHGAASKDAEAGAATGNVRPGLGTWSDIPGRCPG